jgi:hypothetical protein
MIKPTAAVRLGAYGNRAEHARLLCKQKTRQDRCFLLIGAKRQTIFRLFSLTPAPAVCGRFSSLAQSRASQHRKETVMSNKPTHRAYVVSTPKKEGDKGIWREVGAVWPHKNGKGFDVVLHEGIAVHGRIVCTEPREPTAEE